MNLRESIQNIPADDWLEISEQSTGKHANLIGRAPKSLIMGEVLDYEVLYINDTQCRSDYTLHRFIVKDNWQPKF
jgi:hypothetical protein